MLSLYNIKQLIFGGLLCSLAIAQWACRNDDADLEAAPYSTNPEVFIDNFSAGLNYASFSGAVPTAFEVDRAVTFNNSELAMRFDVPNVNDPRGTYAGGAFFTSVGRNLSGYNCLTFWAKASVAATLDVVGFGIDLGENKYATSRNNLPLTTAWKKYIIPIPDPAKLTLEKGMFYLSEGPENGNGYTFWIDEVRFENLGTIAHPQAVIFDGQSLAQTTFVGITTDITGIKTTFNMPDATNQVVNASPYYFNFQSSDTTVATVSANGKVTAVGSGETTITATLGGALAQGALTLTSQGNFTPAPAPAYAPDKVLSIFSDAYTNVPVEYYNGYWAPYQTTQSADFTVSGDHILNYTNFNFVGIQFSQPPIDISAMSHFRVSVYLPNMVNSAAVLKIALVDFGADGVFGGNNDTRHEVTYTAAALRTREWVTLTIPVASMTGLASKNHIAQIIFEGTNIPSFYADNILFYDDGSVVPATPTTAAPTPTRPASNVISVFSDAYTNIAGTNLNPSWGQATQVSQVSIAGNNTLKYGGLNYQGIQLGAAQNLTAAGMTHFHLDYYSTNSSSLKVYLISPGPVETPRTLTVPTTTGWNSVDIPLSAFAPVNLANVFQLKFDGNGDIFLDNLYFYF